MSDWSQWQAELERRRAVANAMGGEDKIKRQHDKGRLTARERIEQLFDADSFIEYGELAAGNPVQGNAVPADGLVGGVGLIDQQSVVVMAEDFTVQGGSIGHVNAAKRVRLATLAGQQKLPLVFVLDGAGERASNALERYPRSPNDLQVLAQLKGKVPIVALVLGVSAGHGALAAAFADFAIITIGSSLFTAGPLLVKAALGKTVAADELGGAEMHTGESGVAHNLVESEPEAFGLCRQYLRYFYAAEPAAVEQLITRCVSEIVPVDTYAPYDMTELLEVIVDSGSLLLLQPDFGRSICVALARIDGQSLMVIASQPLSSGGAITRHAADKAAHWLLVAGEFKLPVVFLADTPGVMPGPDAEREGTLSAAAAFYLAQNRLGCAKVHVTIRKAFGFGSSMMAMNPFDDQLMTMAFPNASLGAMPGEVAATASKEADTADQLQLQQSAAWSGADNMAYDRIITPDSLRDELIAALSINR